MNPFVFALRRPLTTLILGVVLMGGGLFGLYKMHVDIPALNTTKIYAYLDSVGLGAKEAEGHVAGQPESNSHAHEEEAGGEQHRIVVTSPKAKDVVITRPYVCQIHSQRHINVCALEGGYLAEILVREGQAVKKGDPMFRIVPTLYQARLDAEAAKAQLAQLKFNNTKKLRDQNVVSENEVLLLQAELLEAEAKKKLAGAELDFANVKASFDGIVDRLHEREGSLIKEGDILTTLSDNSVMWVYFNVPEKTYLEYMAEVGQNKASPDIELVLADHKKFAHTGKFDPIRRQGGAIEAKFNNETGNISFRADFPNPDRLLRHGQTGTVLINRALKDAIVIPQRATFENLAKQYVYVVGQDDVVHQREIDIAYELDDIYLISKGVDVNDKIILEGIRQVRDGEKVKYEFRRPEEVMANQKNKAE